MNGLGINIGSSVFKRETRPLEEVSQQLREDGWVETGSIGSRVRYFEKTGINVTAIGGPMGTTIVPSGPVRGRLLGNSGLMVNRDTVLGSGRVEGERGRQKRKSQEAADQMV